MHDGYSTDLQKGVNLALKANADIVTLVGARIYDKPPTDPTFPYILLGNFQVNSEDTDGTLSAFVTASIEAHSNSLAGSISCQRVIEAIRAVLHRCEQNVTLANHVLVELIEQTAQVSRNPSGVSFTGVAVYRAYLDSKNLAYVVGDYVVGDYVKETP